MIYPKWVLSCLLALLQATSSFYHTGKVALYTLCGRNEPSTTRYRIEKAFSVVLTVFGCIDIPERLGHRCYWWDWGHSSRWQTIGRVIYFPHLVFFAFLEAPFEQQYRSIHCGRRFGFWIADICEFQLGCSANWKEFVWFYWWARQKNFDVSQMQWSTLPCKGTFACTCLLPPCQEKALYFLSSFHGCDRVNKSRWFQALFHDCLCWHMGF